MAAKKPNVPTDLIPTNLKGRAPYKPRKKIKKPSGLRLLFEQCYWMMILFLTVVWCALFSPEKD